MSLKPSVLVFDVNETLIDIESISPLFTRIFGDAKVMREWFGQLIVHSMTATTSGRYVDFFTLGQGVLRMIGAVHRVDIDDDDVGALATAMLTMPAHPDVEEGLTLLRDNNFRLVTLTNSPPDAAHPSPLERAGLGRFFEAKFSVDSCREFKPAPATYRFVCEQLAVHPAECMMVAAHTWDVIGAQAVGFSGALITRSGNAPLPVAGLPRPTVIAADVRELASNLTHSAAPTSTR